MYGQAGDKVPIVISTLLDLSKQSQSPVRMFSLLGVAVSVLIRLKHTDVEPSARLSQDLKVCFL